MPYRGRLELVIDTDGRVESATLLDSVHPSYDQVLLRAAREWTYEPALKDGQPVKFRKVLAINVEHR
jgi:TonB family protein